MLVKFLLFLEYNAKQMFARWEKGNLISFQSTLKSLNNNLLRCFPLSELAQNLHKNSTKYLQIAKIKTHFKQPWHHWRNYLQNVSSRQSLHKILESQFYFGESWTLWLALAQKWYIKIIFKKTQLQDFSIDFQLHFRLSDFQINSGSIRWPH